MLSGNTLCPPGALQKYVLLSSLESTALQTKEQELSAMGLGHTFLAAALVILYSRSVSQFRLADDIKTNIPQEEGSTWNSNLEVLNLK